MTRSEFVALLSKHFPERELQDVDAAVHHVFDHMTQGLAEGRRVELRGLGSFGTRQHTAHTGRNPRTGETVAVREKKVPYFRAGKELRERVNHSKHEKGQHCG
ncbi:MULTISPECIES: integration host factor subunit beta [unclassified Saccharibacter]|uniref:integration host factor subunit beta n=1 Tax=unclassified Saccharibacter TaxID=2648722 RepID=UPI00132C3145|nr:MULTISPECIES: integration host factor subunit beta [unclassified Saccharibacter]MXV35465.1 integration host factor subunit beta [Saccharibacter sp. EH611]MXV58125.1 integration host factor subunit beta [Saccharibacter sp. EH70]MXV65399.1 integration host factor subunit beta [Saccharibacter sp. EH60]